MLFTSLSPYCEKHNRLFDNVYGMIIIQQTSLMGPKKKVQNSISILSLMISPRKIKSQERGARGMPLINLEIIC